MTLTECLLATEADIFAEFIRIAKTMGLNYIYDRDNYLWIRGNSNIALSAHVDVVPDYRTNHNYELMLDDDQPYLFGDDLNLDSETPLKEIRIERGIVRAYRDGNRCILGGDDRVGVHIINDILARAYMGRFPCPNTLLFNNEEVGGIGVKKFVQSKPDLSAIELILALDCAYTNEFVWYGRNRSGDAWIENFGWKNRGQGSFSYIAVIGDYVDIPSVNLGCGYSNQHSSSEYIDLEVMNLCKNKVFRMLEEGYVPEQQCPRDNLTLDRDLHCTGMSRNDKNDSLK